MEGSSLQKDIFVCNYSNSIKFVNFGKHFHTVSLFVHSTVCSMAKEPGLCLLHEMNKLSVLSLLRRASGNRPPLVWLVLWKTMLAICCLNQLLVNFALECWVTVVECVHHFKLFDIHLP